jgi:hypothetical protein
MRIISFTVGEFFLMSVGNPQITLLRYRNPICQFCYKPGRHDSEIEAVKCILT